MVTSESGCPVVIENWLAPQFANAAGVGTVGNAAINIDKHEFPGCTLGSYPASVEKVKAPLKFVNDTLESVSARSRPPNFIKWLP
jgi:hypothetical protein